MWKLLILLLYATAATAQYYTIGTVAGGGPSTGQSAPSIGINYPTGVATDQLGNIYIAAAQANQVYVFGPNFTLIEVVGNGSAGFSGDGGPATNAQLLGPLSVAVDASGNLFIADVDNFRVRKVNAHTGIITTFAGTGTSGFSGDGGLASSAQIYSQGLAVDGAGNLFIADTFNDRIRRVDAQTSIITTVAGNGTYGFSGDGGPAITAQLSNPLDVAVDGAGNLYI